MSREKFVVAWLGSMGEFVGSVYQFKEGQCLCSPATHPKIWMPGAVERWTEQEAYLAALKEQGYGVAAQH